jgi:uncharacterized membrane protein YiaA
MKGEMPVSNRNSLKLLFQRPVHRKGTLAWLGVVLSRALQSNSYTGVLLKLPVLWVIVVIYPLTQFAFEDALIRALSSPVVAAAVIYLLVNQRWLLFLGEAERYLNHVGYFITILAYGCIYWIIESSLLHKLSTGSKSTDDLVIQYLAEIHEKKVVLAYPFHSCGGVWRIMLETGHKVIYPPIAAANFVKVFNEKYMDKYPFIDLNKVDSLAEDYHVNILVVSETDLLTREVGNWTLSTNWRKAVEYGDSCAIYEKSIN